MCIRKAPSPKNLTQLKSYLGLLNYYATFIPMLSSKLIHLCRAISKFRWSKEYENIFQASKEMLTSNHVRAHYNPTLPIYLTAESSGYGVGAVLSHRIW